MQIAYLYTPSELTPWKENVNEETLAFLLAHTPSDIIAVAICFEGFNDEMCSKLKEFDLVFNLCYGYKDAGQVEVAGWLEHNRIPHTASEFESMSIAQDKSLLPDLCNALSIPTPTILVETHDLLDSMLYIAKPRKGSCHRNITIETGAWMKKFLDPISNDLIIQPYVGGREFSVAVIPAESGQYYMALPPVEIIPVNRNTIYIAGNSFGTTTREMNPVISNELEDKLMDYAEQLHKSIGLRGMSRTDFRMADDETIYVLDVNAMPNMDPEKSLLPALCRHHEISLTDLINRMVKNHEFNVHSDNKKPYLKEKMMFI